MVSATNPGAAISLKDLLNYPHEAECMEWPTRRKGNKIENNCF
jgi:hypothetical protein